MRQCRLNTVVGKNQSGRRDTAQRTKDKGILERQASSYDKDPLGSLSFPLFPTGGGDSVRLGELDVAGTPEKDASLLPLKLL